MSILNKPYEISVWKDEWDADKGRFIEVKIETIGSDAMCKNNIQHRAIEPNFVKNINGVKKFSFKMYKQYINIQTGEKVENEFCDLLISERKVKLKYEDKWHDFIVKNVVENSSNYLYTYQLEDALVQELSKNGFNIALDEKLKNNIGTANELASQVLKETDWQVHEDSEAFVQTVEEALVYLTFPTNYTKTVYHITDQTDLKNGVGANALSSTECNALGGKTVLAFYSSCTNKPHRFQFIYTNNTLNRDEERYIINKDCQYYIDFDTPEADYSVYNSQYGFYLPTGFNTTTVSEKVSEDSTATTSVTLSGLYRGKRYGFAQQSKYLPELDRYVQLYTGPVYDTNKTEYYGYCHSDYISPALIQNIVSNYTFESTSGWTATRAEEGGDKATIERVYGYFEGGSFVDSMDELKAGTFLQKDSDGKTKPYAPYLKLTFDTNSAVINSGPFDNRTIIGVMDPNDKWAMKYECLSSNGSSFTGLDVSLGEYVYYSAKDYYDEKEGARLTFSNFAKDSSDTDDIKFKGYSFSTVEAKRDEAGVYSKEEFKKKMQVRMRITASTPGTYYLKGIELFKASYTSSGALIVPEEQGNTIEEGVIEKTYYYFTENEIEDVTNEEQRKTLHSSKLLTYDIYKPKYNEGAQKVRSITTKESNYFNILQTIAETFEAWLTLEIERDSNGGITQKWVKFKNYAGKENHAYFRYGVNLKDIQRTYESKNIVTKLIVKQNSNQYADGGFCTIQRAGANPTGENYIYDFQYFFNQGLLSARDYLDVAYVVNGARGKDIDSSHTNTNLQGYFPRIKAINKNLIDKNEVLINKSADLTQYKAEKETVEAGMAAAASGVEQTREDFQLLTGAPIDYISDSDIRQIVINSDANSETEVIDRYEDEDGAKANFGIYYTERDWISSITASTNNTAHTITITVNVKADKISKSKREVYVKFFPKVFVGKSSETQDKWFYVTPSYSIKCEIAENATSGTATKDIHVVDAENNNVQKKLKEFAEFVTKEREYTDRFNTIDTNLTSIQEAYNQLKEDIEELKEQKRALNELFFSRYSRFIQEGTWISEEYVDDELYYADALSIIYNSCYPQVAYAINVLELSKLPGYEDFVYELGDRTYVIDPEFFGDRHREKIVVTEIVENLDDPSKNQIKVQNFKNQFQDLFQKITATVQQAEYSTGSYEKAVALAEANQEKKQQFLTDALDSASARLSAAGQQSVTWGNDGITVKSVNSPSDAIRMVGGAILLSKQDENGQQKWVTGVTSDGVSASLITAGVLNAGEIAIMNYDEPVFRWDAFGISAYDAIWYDGEIGTTISGVNSKKFVRFDKHGIYGVNGGVDGANWHPTGEKDIASKSSFHLTWDGFKLAPENIGYSTAYNKDGGKIRLSSPVSPNKNSIKIGRVDDIIYNAWTEKGVPFYDENKSGEKFVKVIAIGQVPGEQEHVDETFVLYSNGTLVANDIKLNGSIGWTEMSSPSKSVYGETSTDKPQDGERYPDFNDTEGVWHKKYNDEKDLFYCHTDNGGATWEGPFPISGKSIVNTKSQYCVDDVGLTINQLNEINTWYDSISEAGLIYAGKCLYIRTYDIYNDGTHSDFRYMSGISPIANLTLEADTLVVQESQNGFLTPDKITLTAKADYLVDTDGYSWTGVEASGNTAVFYTEGMPDSHTITVEYAGHTDSVTIIKVKEGSDAISIVLTNPTMVFNKSAATETEKTGVAVYRGANKIPYGESDDGWYFTLQENSDYIAINGIGEIIVTNPTEPCTLKTTLILYKGSEETKEEMELEIYCQILKDNISISLTNDSGVVVTDKDGNGGKYEQNTITTVEVRQGGEKMEGWTFSAEPASSSTFTWEEIEDGTFHVTKISEDVEVLTIKASKEGFSDLTTTFKVSKLKQGASTTTCYVDSSAGTFFANTASGTTTLTAKIFNGDVEIDEYGTNLNYIWYFNDEEAVDWGRTKWVENLNIADLLEKTVFFRTEEKAQS